MSASRPTRSRISSPFAPVPSIETTDSTADKSKPKTMLDRWVGGEAGESSKEWTEPPLVQKASFQEAGHVRHGAVLNMMPLGVGPSAKVLKALAKGEAERPKRSAFSTPDVEATTPEEQQQPPPPPTENEAEQQNTPPTTMPEEDVEALPATPQQPTSARKSVSVSRPSVGPQSAGQSVFALQSPVPLAIPAPQQAPQRYPRYMSETPEPALGPDGLAVYNLDFTDKVVENAVQEAIDRLKWPTAYALRTLYDESRTDPAKVRMFDAVYNGWATKEQIDEFRTTVRQRKYEGKKGRTGEYYFNGDGEPGPSRPIFNAINLVNPPAPTYQTPYTTLPQRPSTGTNATPPVVRSSSMVPPPSASVPASPQPDHEHINKKQRSNSFQPIKTEVNKPEINGHAATNGAVKSPSPAPQENGAPKSTPRARRSRSQSRSRSRSNSSSSSLSSVNEEIIEDSTILSPPRPTAAAPPPSMASHLTAKFGIGLGLGLGLGLEPPRFVSPYASANNFQEAALSAETQARNAARPISAPPKPGPRTFTFSTVTSSSASSSPALPRPSSANPSSSAPVVANDTSSAPAISMAPTALLHSSSNSSTTSTTNKKFPATFKIKNATKLPAAAVPQDENDTNSRLKRKAKEITGKAATTESFERHHVPTAEAAEWSDGGDSIAVTATTKRKKKQKAPKLRLLHRSRETRQNSRYASDEGSSPTELAFKAPFPPGESLPSSRAGTPNASNRPARKPKAGSGLRYKTSPMKKKTGTSAGIPKDTRSPTSNGGPPVQDGENDDFCSACGGNGELVCCDGCTRSFHFICVDPPIEEDSENLESEWFCNSCVCKQHGGQLDEDTGGLWGRLLADFEDKNPRAFHLPQPIRDFFVDVKTGPEGEYEEIAPPKPKNNRAGWEEAPDYFRKKDAKGKIILCHRCNGEASTPNRMIIPCSFCGLSWHLDCLPVPLAKEPGPGRQWRCPAHVDDLLAVLPHSMAPAHRFRKIKGAPTVIPRMSRGIKNNGHIEIENALSDDEEEQGFYELREFGKVYKLPEASIKLDFISRVKQMRGHYLPSLYSSRPRTEPSSRTSVQSAPGAQRPWTQRSIDEQQAALNLSSLIASTNDPALADGTGILINTLLAQAPPAVISLVAQSDSKDMAARKLSKKEKLAMAGIFEFLKRKLEEPESSSDEEEPAPATPVAPVQESSAIPLPKDTASSIPSPVATVTGAVEDSSGADEDTEMLL